MARIVVKSSLKTHPFHYSADKNLLQRLLDFGVPIGLFLIYFKFYNFGKVSPSEMVRTSGLMAISLLALTLVVGPIARLLPALDILKAHRKFWGITSFLFLILHLSLVIIFYFNFNVAKLFDTSSPKFLGFAVGMLALVILLMVTLTSNQKALKKLDPQVWKSIQMSSYLALVLAVAHFYFMEQVNGVLVIKRLLGQITFWFATAVVVIRLIVIFYPQKRK